MAKGGVVAEQQLTPEQQQVVGAEVQEPIILGSPPPVIKEEEKRTVPLPVAGRPVMPAGQALAQAEAQQVIYGVPIAKLGHYVGTDGDFVELVRWDVTPGFTGDLHEISLLSTNDANTRYRLVIGNVDQKLPTDRQTSTPLDFKWQRGVIPGGTSVFVQVRALAGVNITVDGVITGTER